jgi:hypothetical protein
MLDLDWEGLCQTVMTCITKVISGLDPPNSGKIVGLILLSNSYDEPMTENFWKRLGSKAATQFTYILNSRRHLTASELKGMSILSN